MSGGIPQDGVTPGGAETGAAAEAAKFRARLCHALVADRLQEMELELLSIKSAKALSGHPWVGGKRLRPIVFLLSYLSTEAAAGRATASPGREVPLAAALELMHEASLVHDDLVDRSSVRRGKPTVQMTNGAGRALLMGDYMVFRALKMVLDAARSAEDIRLAQELADTALEIAHGQLMQLERYLDVATPEQRMSMDDYLDIICKKTALFFAGCAEGGVALARGSEEARRRYHSFGLDLGVTFQMLDDLIDVVGDPDVAAKSLDNNLSEGTVTLPFIEAWHLEPDHPAIGRLARGEPLSAADRASALALVRSEPVVARCRDVVADRARKVVETLGQLPANVFTSGLDDLARYVFGCSWGGVKLLDGVPGVTA